MRKIFRLVLFVFVLGTGNASYSFTKYENKKSKKNIKKSLTYIAIPLYDQV
jgi:hypothetical protein